MDNKLLKNPPKKYRPSPFWSWNEKLDTEETVSQVKEMESVGLGGYFMHARGGLQTEYLSDEWFDNVDATVNAGEELGMRSWGYDENGWPSGFGGGFVNGMGVKYQQKYLRMEYTDAPKQTETTITNVSCDGKNYHFFYEINPFYVDTLDSEVIDEFIRVTHSEYKKRLGKDFSKLEGFFTDEPQVSRNGFPWSFIMEREYKKAYGEELAPLLPCLFDRVGDYTRVRYNFWRLVRDLFTDAYMKRIHDWCIENGSKVTGHMVIEEGFVNHIYANGCCMPSYEYFDIPGMDHLGRSLANLQTKMQLTSVANQLGKKQILSETFALSGWNVSFEDLRWIYEDQMVHGVNYLCQHLEGYSLRGIRKRDYPASLFKHQPWWKDYKLFNDYVSRIGMLVAEGKIDYNILVIHTIESAWLDLELTLQKSEKNIRLCNEMLETMNSLEREQLQYHLGDARIMERHGKVQNGVLTVGTQNYSVVVVPPCTCIAENTLKLLKQFKAEGGLLIFSEKVPTMVNGIESAELAELVEGCLSVDHNTVAEYIPDTVRKLKLEYNGDRITHPVHSLVRELDDRIMYYLYNPCTVKHDVKVTVKGKRACIFNPSTGEEAPAVFRATDDGIEVECTLYERGSCVIFTYDDADNGSAADIKPELIPLGDTLKGEWEIVDADDNSLTLDYCDLYFDGELIAENLPIGDVQEKAVALERKVNVTTVFKAEVGTLEFSRCELAVETPEIFDIFVNGVEIDKTVTGYYRDKSFKTIDIYKYLKVGTNEIKLECEFSQSDAVYENCKKSLIFESEKNKLSYDMEIEAIYLKGDFAVKTDEPFEYLDKRGIKTAGGFYLTKAVKTVTDGELASQGYPFFNGTVTLRKKITLAENEIHNRSIRFSRLCSTVTKVAVNGQDAGTVVWQPYEVDLSDKLSAGENTVDITVTGNLRNLLGPFHLTEGECLRVSPGCFFNESPLWSIGRSSDWTDTYCFVEYGLFF